MIRLYGQVIVVDIPNDMFVLELETRDSVKLDIVFKSRLGIICKSLRGQKIHVWGDPRYATENDIHITERPDSYGARLKGLSTPFEIQSAERETLSDRLNAWRAIKDGWHPEDQNSKAPPIQGIDWLLTLNLDDSLLPAPTSEGNASFDLDTAYMFNMEVDLESHKCEVLTELKQDEITLDLDTQEGMAQLLNIIRDVRGIGCQSS